MTRGAASFTGVSESVVGPWRVFHVPDPHALTQVAGWLKYTADGGQVLFRGQTEIHPSLAASAFRGQTEPSLNLRTHALRGYIDQLLGGPCHCARTSPTSPHPPYGFGYAHLCTEKHANRLAKDSPIVSGTYRAAVEPLLQHYGLKTRWLDVVDNIWVALWFACHHQVTRDRYAHFLRRSVAQEGPDARAVIVVVDTGPTSETGVPGYQVGRDCRVVDLRYCVPSVYLRPHAQHGLLMAPRRLTAGTAEVPVDIANSLNSLVAGIIEIKLGDALDWLGEGGMTSTFTLFPPATKDEGFRRLLETKVDPHTPEVGSITYYGPGY